MPTKRSRNEIVLHIETNKPRYRYTLVTKMTRSKSKGKSTGSCSWQQILLCEDLLYNVLQFSSADELIHGCTLVCKVWHSLIHGKNYPLWRLLLFHELIHYHQSLSTESLAKNKSVRRKRTVSQFENSHSPFNRTQDNDDSLENDTITNQLHNSNNLNFFTSLLRNNRFFLFRGNTAMTEDQNSCDHNDELHSRNWKREYYRFQQLVQSEKFWSQALKCMSNNSLSYKVHLKSMIFHSPPRSYQDLRTGMVKCMIRLDHLNRFCFYHEDTETLIMIAQLLSSTPNNNNNTNLTTMSSQQLQEQETLSSLFSVKKYGIYLPHDNKKNGKLIAQLQSSRFGLQFDLHDYDSIDPSSIRINYRMNLLGFGGYNKLDVTIPNQKLILPQVMMPKKESISSETVSKQQPNDRNSLPAADQNEIVSHFGRMFLKKKEFQRSSSSEGEHKTSANDQLMSFTNRPPVWNVKHKSWSLDFGGRVKVRSVKNFQLMEQNAKDNQMNYLLMGRINSNSFVIDYGYPFNALQAFCVALSALDHKLACP